MKRGQRGSDKDKTKAIELRKNGATYRAIADKLGVTILTASRWAKNGSPKAKAETRAALAKKAQAARSAQGQAPGPGPDTESLARWIAFGVKYNLIRL